MTIDVLESAPRRSSQWPGIPTLNELVEIRRIVKEKGASPKVIADLTRAYRLDSTVAESLRREAKSMIFESAPNPKGPTMANRTIASLSKDEGQQILVILRKNGTAPQVIANVSQQYRIEESSVKAIAQVLTESASKRESFSESAAHAAVDGMYGALDKREARILYEAAQGVLDGATRAETDLSTASISDLEAFATMGIARQAWSS